MARVGGLGWGGAVPPDARSLLARWNNEAADSPDANINANFAKTQKWAMIKAEGDSMIFPNEGEWWGKFGECEGDHQQRRALRSRTRVDVLTQSIAFNAPD